MDQGNNITANDVHFLRNAQLLMEQKGLHQDEIAGIVVDPRSLLVAESPDTGVMVTEGIAKNKRVRVVVSEKEVTGGSVDHPLVINTIVLGDVAPGQASSAPSV